MKNKIYISTVFITFVLFSFLHCKQKNKIEFSNEDVFTIVYQNKSFSKAHKNFKKIDLVKNKSFVLNTKKYEELLLDFSQIYLLHIVNKSQVSFTKVKDKIIVNLIKGKMFIKSNKVKQLAKNKLIFVYKNNIVKPMGTSFVLGFLGLESVFKNAKKLVKGLQHGIKVLKGSVKFKPFHKFMEGVLKSTKVVSKGFEFIESLDSNIGKRIDKSFAVVFGQEKSFSKVLKLKEKNKTNLVDVSLDNLLTFLPKDYTKNSLNTDTKFYYRNKFVKYSPWKLANKRVKGKTEWDFSLMYNLYTKSEADTICASREAKLPSKKQLFKAYKKKYGPFNFTKPRKNIITNSFWVKDSKKNSKGNKSLIVFGKNKKYSKLVNKKQKWGLVCIKKFRAKIKPKNPCANTIATSYNGKKVKTYFVNKKIDCNCGEGFGFSKKQASSKTVKGYCAPKNMGAVVSAYTLDGKFCWCQG